MGHNYGVCRSEIENGWRHSFSSRKIKKWHTTHFRLTKSCQRNIQIILSPLKFSAKRYKITKTWIFCKLRSWIALLRVYKNLEPVYTHLCYLSVFLHELLCTWLYLLSFISVYSQNVAQWKEVFVKICLVILLLGGMHKLNLLDAQWRDVIVWKFEFFPLLSLK